MIRGSHGRLDLTSWASAALGESEAIVLDRWADRLEAQVYAIARSPKGPFSVSVFARKGALREHAYHAHGELAVTIASCLMAMEKQQDLVDDELADLGFTAEELVSVAAQSGMSVSRA